LWEPGGHRRHTDAAETQARADRPSLRDIGLLGGKP
jgi:hypothetical protein